MRGSAQHHANIFGNTHAHARSLSLAPQNRRHNIVKEADIFIISRVPHNTTTFPRRRFSMEDYGLTTRWLALAIITYFLGPQDITSPRAPGRGRRFDARIAGSLAVQAAVTSSSPRRVSYSFSPIFRQRAGRPVDTSRRRELSGAKARTKRPTSRRAIGFTLFSLPRRR